MACTDKRDPVSDFLSLIYELEAYQPGLASRPFVVAANKMDVGKIADKQLKRFKEYGMHPKPTTTTTAL
jgi:GTPase involved in cell partitioning and DNA repair